MKLENLFFLAAVALSAVACSSPESQGVESYSEGLRFCEGTTLYGGNILVSNFGSAELSPLNTEGKGYIMMLEEGELKPFIECDGNLSAPKGMCVVGDYLLVADVNKVVIYNIADISQAPQVVPFPESELFVNDIAQCGDRVLISVTNTGSIYSMDISTLADATSQPLEKVGQVAGANGIAVKGESIYIASYDPTDNPSSENVIYVATFAHGGLEVRPLIEDMPYGQYDGIALTSDGEALITTTWTSSTKDGAAIWSIDLQSGVVSQLLAELELNGPADITVKGGELFIPELVQSKLYKVAL